MTLAPIAPARPSYWHAPVPFPAETLEITAAKALLLLRVVVADAGRHHRCPVFAINGMPRDATFVLWVHAGRPVCISARVLHRAGIPVSALAECEGYTVTQALERGLPVWPVVVTPGGQEVMQAAETAQDAGLSWGEALRSAEMASVRCRARGMR